MKKFLLILIILLTAVAGYFYVQPQSYHYLKFNLQEPSGYASTGLDVSHHQGKINWDEVFAADNHVTIDFVYLKVTEGKTHVDTQWKRNRKALLKRKIKHGAYHFMATKSYPWPQVEHFLKNYSYKVGDLPPVLDVELEGFSDEDLIAKMKIWLDAVEQSTGIRPIIYTSDHFYTTKFRNKFPNTKFWIASYSRSPKYLSDDAIVHWQWTKGANINGIGEKVDLNVSKLIY
ncbi:glycoside hydrolase family 25 protein [Lishizhenia tianjinensis]|uniref:glycoside hydrolase family 25 protein n=1 Tax=Lishizhenia tianjinensis TaxID=477690 RepID=UPI00147CF60D|nr:GH25 family lysozyme [Lishizhenia tianjinensis]